MNIVKNINCKSGAVFVALAAILMLIAFGPSSAQSAGRGKDSVGESNAIKQYCSAKFRGDKAGRDRCIKEGEEAMERLDKRGVDPKIKAYCRNAVGFGRPAALEKCISSLEKPRPKAKPVDKRKGIIIPSKKSGDKESKKDSKSIRKSCDRPELPNCGN